MKALDMDLRERILSAVLYGEESMPKIEGCRQPPLPRSPAKPVCQSVHDSKIAPTPASTIEHDSNKARSILYTHDPCTGRGYHRLNGELDAGSIHKRWFTVRVISVAFRDVPSTIGQCDDRVLLVAMVVANYVIDFRVRSMRRLVERTRPRWLRSASMTSFRNCRYTVVVGVRARQKFNSSS
jgi:hypothetical protein